MTRWPLLLIILALGCSTATAQTGTSQPTAQSSQQTVAGDPCVVNGQTYCVLNPAVTPQTIGQTICAGGWDKNARKDADLAVGFAAEKRKALALARPQHPDWTSKNTEWDHRLAGGMGGSWSDSGNLSLQFADEGRSGDTTHNRKDDAEAQGHDDVCYRGLPLRQVQSAFVQHWLGPFPTYKA